jgi:subtilisin family serine protease
MTAISAVGALPSRSTAGGRAAAGTHGSTDGDSTTTRTITLITGQTIHVIGEGDDRRYTVEPDRNGYISVVETDEGTYVLPNALDVDLDRFNIELFNVDFLIDQGLTDAETATIPVILRLDPDLVNVQRDGPLAMTDEEGFTPTKYLESSNAWAGEVHKEHGRAAVESVLSDDIVECVSLDARYEAVPVEPAEGVNAAEARAAFGVDGDSVSIAILDTGIDTDHPDLGDRVLHEADFSGDGVQDTHGHGTRVAGIAAGGGPTSVGESVGVAPGAELWNLKVLGDAGRGALSDVVAGIEHATEEGADVLTLSLDGSMQENNPMQHAIDYAHDGGVTVSLFAENGSGDERVTSLEQSSSAVTVGGDGTSAAHVAGIVALLLEYNPEWTPDDVRERLISTADAPGDEAVLAEGVDHVNAFAALDSDLRVRSAVTDFGQYDEPTTATTTIDIENVGDDVIDLDTGAELWNAQRGEFLDDTVSVTPSSLTIGPGETAAIDVGIATTDAHGRNVGTLTLETVDGMDYHAIVGFEMGVQVVVTKQPHERSGGVEGDTLQTWTHDGSFSHEEYNAFDEDGEYRFLLLDDGGEFTFWSQGGMAPPEGQTYGKPTLTVKSGVYVDHENTHVTIDEDGTVPRELDTAQIGHHEPFEMREFNIDLFGLTEEGDPARYGLIYLGDFGYTTVHVSPIDEADPTNLTTGYLMTPRELTDEYPLDSPSVYHLLYGTLSIPDRRHAITVEADGLAAEQFQYNRNYEDPLHYASPRVHHTDQEHFPGRSLGFVAAIGDRLEQTWYATDQGVYDDIWRSWPPNGDSRDWFLTRLVDLVPDAEAAYTTEFNRDPLMGYVSEWELADGSLDLRGHWYADQAHPDRPLLIYKWDRSNENEYTITVNGVIADTGTSIGHSFSASADHVPEGSVVGVSTVGNTLVDSPRQTTTVTDYEVTYEPGTTNVPPQIEYVDVTGLSVHNEVPAGRIVVFVEIDADDIDDFCAYYAETDSVSKTPFEDPAGWHDADVVYKDGTNYGVVVDALGTIDSLALAVTTSDSAGNSLENTTFSAVTIDEGADLAADIDVEADEFDPGSNRPVPVRIGATDEFEPHRIEDETLRFGAPTAVHSGDGVSPLSVQRLPDGDLRARFRANDAGFECEQPTVAQLVGTLEDGREISGVDVIEEVRCSG